MSNQIIDRVEEFMATKNLNNNQLTKIAGLSIGMLGKARRTRKGFHSDSIEKILNAFPELSPDYLIMGKGPMFRPSEQKELLLTASYDETSQNRTYQLLANIIREKDRRIETLNRKIGALKQEIQHLNSGR